MKATDLIWHYLQSCDKTDGEYDLLAAVSTLNRAISMFYDEVSPVFEKNERANRWMHPLNCTDVDLKKSNHTSEYDLFEFPEDWGNIYGVYIRAKKGNCPVIGFESHPIRNKSKNGARDTKYWKPSYLFEHSFWKIDKKGVKIYHGGDFKIIDAKVDYLECIPDIHPASLQENTDGTIGYVYGNGEKVTRDVDLKVGKGAFNYILQIASLLKGDASSADLQREIVRILNLKNIL